MQNTIERAVILTEAGRPVTAAALGLPGDLRASEATPAVQEEAAPDDYSADNVAAGFSNHPVAVTNGTGGVLPIAELEKQAIKAALHQTGGNRTQAAARLGGASR